MPLSEREDQGLPYRESVPIEPNGCPATSLSASKRSASQAKNADTQPYCRNLCARLRNKSTNRLFRAAPSASPILVMFQPT